MLEVCKESHHTALAVYEPRLKLYPSQEEPSHMFRNAISRPGVWIRVYTRKEQLPIAIQLESKALSIAVWMERYLGFGKETISIENVTLDDSLDWSPAENKHTGDCDIFKKGTQALTRADIKIWIYNELQLTVSSWTRGPTSQRGKAKITEASSSYICMIVKCWFLLWEKIL